MHRLTALSFGVILVLAVAAPVLAADTGPAAKPAKPGEPTAPKPAKPTEPTTPKPAEPAVPKTFTSADGHFQIDFPGTPKQSSDETDTPIGKVTYHSFTLELPKSGLSYSVVYSDVADKAIPNQSVDRALDKARDGVIKSLNGQLVKEDKLTVAGNPARDLTIDTSDPKFNYRWRLLYQKNRQFQLIVSTKGKPTDETEAKRFFDSFKLMDEK